MAVSIVGTPQLVSGGGTYTAEAGSNRLVVVALAREPSGTGTTANVSTLQVGTSTLANGEVVQASIKQQSGALARNTAGIWYVKEADIDAGAMTIDATWSIAMGGAANLFTCYTLAGVDQTTPIDAIDSVEFVGGGSSSWSDSFAVAANTVQILSAAVNGANASTPTSPWSEVRDTSDTAYRAVSHSNTNASATTLSYGLSFGGANTGVIAVASFAPATAVAPTFGVSPTVTSQTASAYTIGYTADANADDIYVGAYPKDATAPTAAQLKAGTGAHGTATEATTGASDSIVLTPSDTPKFPLYDIYAVLEGAGGFSSVVALTDEFLDPPAGKQFQVLASVSGTSPLTGETPTIVAGDIWVLDLASIEDAYDITPTDTGDYTMDRGGDTSRQSFAHDVYDVSLAAYYGAGTVYDGNQPPNFIGGGPAFFNGTVYKKDEDQGTIALSAAWDDAEGDTRTFALAPGSDPLPTGWSLAADGDITDPPTAYGTYDFTLRVTDSPPGDYTDLADSVVIGDEMPDVVGQAEATAITNVEAVANFTVNTPVETAYSSTVPAGDVIEQFPEAGEYVADDTTVTLTVSLGPVIAGGFAFINDFSFAF